jgi:hypothetical protein
LAVGAVLATGAAATSQDAPAKGEPAVPEPARCAVEPRPIADLEPYAGNGNAGVTIAAASPGADEERADSGEPADPEVAAAATETIETLHACYNANDYPRAFALFTDAGLARVAPGFGLTDKDLAFLAEQPDPPPAPKEAWRAVAVREATAQPDGRLRVAFEERAPDGAFTGVAVLVETDGSYRIDDLSTRTASPDEGR